MKRQGVLTFLALQYPPSPRRVFRSATAGTWGRRTSFQITKGVVSIKCRERSTLRLLVILHSYDGISLTADH